MSEVDTVPPVETGGTLEVPFTERSLRALEVASDLSPDTLTDIINRAVQHYAFALHYRSAGGEFFQAMPDGALEKAGFE